MSPGKSWARGALGSRLAVANANRSATQHTSTVREALKHDSGELSPPSVPGLECSQRSFGRWNACRRNQKTTNCNLLSTPPGRGQVQGKHLTAARLISDRGRFKRAARIRRPETDALGGIGLTEEREQRNGIVTPCRPAVVEADGEPIPIPGDGHAGDLHAIQVFLEFIRNPDGEFDRLEGILEVSDLEVDRRYDVRRPGTDDGHSTGIDADRSRVCGDWEDDREKDCQGGRFHGSSNLFGRSRPIGVREALMQGSGA